MSQIVRIIRIFSPENIIFFRFWLHKSRQNEVQLIIFIPNYIRLIVVSIDNQNSFFHLFEYLFQECSLENMFQKWCPTKKNFCSKSIWYWGNNFRLSVFETLKISVISRCKFFLSMSHLFIYNQGPHLCSKLS